MRHPHLKFALEIKRINSARARQIQAGTRIFRNRNNLFILGASTGVQTTALENSSCFQIEKSVVKYIFSQQEIYAHIS